MKKTGFTLAEILISLTILGVIAALVLPALKTDVDKNTWAQGLKTSESRLTNGFKQMMALEGVESLFDTNLWTNNVSNQTEEGDVTTLSTGIKDDMQKYFSFNNVIEGVTDKAKPQTILNAENSDMTNTIRFYLGNSSTINVAFKKQTDNVCTQAQDFCNPAANIILDVNGDKGPNIIGKDIYRFWLNDDGQLYPYGSAAVAAYDSTTKHWSEACSGKTIEGKDITGYECTDRVIQEGYKITYN